MSGEADSSHGTVKFRATWITHRGEKRGDMKGEEMKDRQEEGKWKITLWPNSKPKAKQAARTNFLFLIIPSGGDLEITQVYVVLWIMIFEQAVFPPKELVFNYCVYTKSV